ncbi:MAG: archaellin/type IV pilin N-terminal domain-containing protein [Thermoplasmataceae archaeon]|jgi:flagellin-like protein
MKIVIRDDEKKDKAVSAIIGTILIVAITVVLAATLYAVLGGFSGLIGKPTPTASMTVAVSGTGSNTQFNATFTSVSSNLSLSDTQLKIVDSNGTYVLTYSNGYSASPPPPGLTVDVYGGGGYLTFNTAILIKDTFGSTITSVYLIDTQTGGIVASQTNL